MFRNSVPFPAKDSPSGPTASASRHDLSLLWQVAVNSNLLCPSVVGRGPGVLLPTGLTVCAAGSRDPAIVFSNIFFMSQIPGCEISGYRPVLGA